MKVVNQGETLFSDWLKIQDDFMFTSSSSNYYMRRPETPYDLEFNTKLHSNLQLVLSDTLDYKDKSSRAEFYKTVVGLSLKKQKVALNLLDLPGVTNSSNAVRFLTEMAIPHPDELTDVFMVSQITL